MLKPPRILIAITSLALSSCIDLRYHGADSELEYYSDVSNGLRCFQQYSKSAKIKAYLDGDPYGEMTIIDGYREDISSATQLLGKLNCRRIAPDDPSTSFYPILEFIIKLKIDIGVVFGPDFNVFQYYRATDAGNLVKNVRNVDYYAIDPDEGKRLKDAVWDIAMKPEESSGESDPGTEETTDSSSAESIEGTSADDAGDPQ